MLFLQRRERRRKLLQEKKFRCQVQKDEEILRGYGDSEQYGEMQLVVNNNLAFPNAFSVFYQFSMRYCGSCLFFFAVFQYWVPPNVPLKVVW